MKITRGIGIDKDTYVLVLSKNEYDIIKFSLRLAALRCENCGGNHKEVDL